MTNASSCPANSATLTTTATSIMNCTCTAGAFANPPNGAACALCPAGSYASAPGLQKFTPLVPVISAPSVAPSKA